jgi:hypothetical protein
MTVHCSFYGSCLFLGRETANVFNPGTRELTKRGPSKSPLVVGFVVTVAGKDQRITRASKSDITRPPC